MTAPTCPALGDPDVRPSKPSGAQRSLLLGGGVQLRQGTQLRPWSCGSARSQDVARDTHLRLRTAENHVLLDRRAAERLWAPGAAGCPGMTWGRCPRLLAGLPRASRKSSALSPLRASVSSSVVGPSRCEESGVGRGPRAVTRACVLRLAAPLQRRRPLSACAP